MPVNPIYSFGQMLYKMSEDDSERSVPGSLAMPAETETVAARRPLILLVEDDFALRRSLAEYLIDEGFDVECAANGMEGLRRVMATQQRTPATILLDMRMPYMDGAEFCAKQRANPELAKVPIIAITGAKMSKAETRSLGLHSAFSKPLNLAKLMEAIREIIPVPLH
jgi:CheY-like chemotaxis protein